MNAPLAGLRVLVTRPEGQADALISGVQLLGATVCYAPTIRIADPPSFDALDDALRHLNRFAWVVWTSANGVRRTFARMDTLGIAPAALRPLKRAVIGASTAQALEQYGLVADLVPLSAVAESLLEAMLAAEIAPGLCVLLPQPVETRDVLTTGLRAHDVEICIAPAYRTVDNLDAAADVRRWMAAGELDLAIVTSPSTVRGLLTMLGDDRDLLARLPLACIGPVTANAVRELGIEPALIADDHTVEGLLHALATYRIGVSTR